MGETRKLALMCGSAAGPSSKRYPLTATLTKEIDAVVGELTGDPRKFHAQPQPAT